MNCSADSLARKSSTQVAISEGLVSEATSLVRRVAAAEPMITEHEREVRVSAPVDFADGVGRGEIIATLFPYRGRVRFDVTLEHDRVFARPDGSATEKRCYLNDYVASIRLESDGQELPAEFVRNVIAGVSASRDAVRRYNKRCGSDWFRVEVTRAAPK
jgi:hypothetical protein